VITLEAGGATATIDADAGGRIASIVVEGHQLLMPRNDDPLGWGLYPMVPFAGRVRDGRLGERQLARNLPPHAIHGTCIERAWTDEGGGRLSIELGPGWPWPGSAIHQVELHEDGIELRLEVHAEDEAFPATCGWHPWFRGDATVALATTRMYVRDADGIPTGELVEPPEGPWDDCFTGITWPARIALPDGPYLEVRSSCDHVVVFDEPAGALCVEPQTGPPDAFNLGLAATVDPDHPLVATMSIRWLL
jgi:aldose 1-epimerase